MSLRLIATAVVSLGVGGLIGYKYAEKKLIADFETRLDRELDVTRRLYKTDYSTPQEMVAKLHGDAAVAMEEYRGEESEDNEPVAYHKIRTSNVKIKPQEEKVTTRKVFEPEDDRGEIYVISVNEHTEGESGYEKVTWTYYAKDNVVTDDQDDRIEDAENFLGERFFDHFGKESGDDNVVYIRSEVVMIDYEIIRSPNAYVEDILGEEYNVPVRPSQRMGN